MEELLEEGNKLVNDNGSEEQSQPMHECRVAELITYNEKGEQTAKRSYSQIVKDGIKKQKEKKSFCQELKDNRLEIKHNLFHKETQVK